MKHDVGLSSELSATIIVVVTMYILVCSTNRYQRWNVQQTTLGNDHEKKRKHLFSYIHVHNKVSRGYFVCVIKVNCCSRAESHPGSHTCLNEPRTGLRVLRLQKLAHT